MDKAKFLWTDKTLKGFVELIIEYILSEKKKQQMHSLHLNYPIITYLIRACYTILLPGVKRMYLFDTLYTLQSVCFGMFDLVT